MKLESIRTRIMWQGAGVHLYKKDSGDANSVGIRKGDLKAVIGYLKRGVGYYGLGNRIDMHRISRGVTLKDYQGRRLFLSNKQLAQAINVLRARL